MRRIARWGVVVCLALLAGVSCNRNKGGEDEVDATPLIEERDEGKLEWSVFPSGVVRVKVAPNEGAATEVSGALLVDGQSYPLKGEGGMLRAEGPALTAELTTMSYSLKVGETTWDGVLHVPAGGTKELVSPPTVEVAEGTKGPNGGIVEVVGDQRVEMVVDEKTGEVRVYLLDDKLQPMPVGDSAAVAAFVQEGAK